MMENQEWLIWSHEHTAWWQPQSNGYCSLRKNAGHYSYKEACEILANANYGLKAHPHEAMVPILDGDVL